MSTAAAARTMVGAPSPSRAWGTTTAVFTLLVVSVTLLQKLGLPAGGGIEVAVLAPWAALAFLLLQGRLVLDPARCVLFGVFAVLVLVSQSLGHATFSLASILLAFVLYAPFCCEVEAPAAVYRRCLEIFLVAMLGLAALVALQDALQLALTARAWINLDRILPHALQVQGYNYFQPISYGSRLYKPNAYFFLEGSFVSEFLALALIVEAALFGRAWRMAAYAIAMLMTFTGSGLLLCALTAPFFIGRLSPRILVSAALAAIAAAGAALYLGWFAQMAHRLSEISTPGSSGYYRFNVPVQIVKSMASDPAYVFTGHGAGSTGKGAGQDVAGFILAPFAKLIYEYGFGVFISFYIFFAYTLFRRAPSLPVAAALFFFYSLGGGGFVVPAYVVTVFTLGVVLRVQPEATPPIRRARRFAPQRLAAQP